MKRYTKRVFRALGGVEPVKGISKIECLQKLASYEDADELGRLVEFPVAIGGHLWHVEACPLSITETVVNGLFTDGKNLFAYAKENGGNSTQTYILSGLGNWLFTDKKQAEAKLKEMEKKNGSKI